MTYMKIVKKTKLQSKYGKIARILVNNGGAPPLFTKIRAIFPYFDCNFVFFTIFM